MFKRDVSNITTANQLFMTVWRSTKNFLRVFRKIKPIPAWTTDGHIVMFFLPGYLNFDSSHDLYFSPDNIFMRFRSAST